MTLSPVSCFLAALGCLPGVVLAVTPAITGVSGVVQHGQILGITGTSMVQEDRTNWDPFFIRFPNASGFEGIDLMSDGYGSNQWGAAVSYDMAIKLMGSQSIKTHLEGQHIRQPDATGMASGSYWWIVDASKPPSGSGWTDLYFRVYSRWNANSWPTKDLKFWWTQNGSTGFWWSFRTHADGSPPTNFGVYPLGATSPDNYWRVGPIPGGALQNGKWYLFEGYSRVQGSGATPYPVKVWVDNQLIIDATTPVGPTPNTWGWESNTNMYDTPVGWTFDYWQDGLAISRTRIGPASLIEVGNCTLYGSGAKLYQEPLFLSDGSSQIRLNLSGLGSGPYVLWVTNNRNERSMPFPLGSGTPSCAQSTVPPPGNLTVR